MAKKRNWTPWIIVGILVILVLWTVGTYNSLIGLDNGVEEKWAQVENQYQRRADLIPNLINTVKGFAAQEKDIFLEVTKLRSQWAGASSRNEKLAAAKGLDSGISKLLLVAENYPQLKSNENFLALQSQLEGTENRVATERKRYNEIVRKFNVKIKRFPSNIIAGMMGYEKKDYFESDEGSETVPKVEF
jgi:LemA protein|tara:strand:- start:28816 stop:29382 length:567 start_codon:yes stop_codon:yes gene_type:complete